MKKTFIIAEAGVNHNGSFKIAKKLVDIAAASGADAVKFQTFKAEKLVTQAAPKAKYQVENMGSSESQLAMLKRLQLSASNYKELFYYCKKSNILFMSTPFDEESVDFLNTLGMKIFKVPSGEITNLPYLRKVGSLKKQVLLSTGMSDLREIRDALKILVKSGTETKKITVLHCHTEYPTPFEEANLLAMSTIRDRLKVKVGYSDHTLGIEAAIAAVALGAAVIEKHFTLDKKMKGPDHKASLEPDELKAMVNAIRNIEKALGDGVKRPSVSEMRNKTIIRKSIVAARDINKGDIFSENNITAKRPGTGISPMEWDKVLNKKASRDFLKDELIEV